MKTTLVLLLAFFALLTSGRSPAGETVRVSVFDFETSTALAGGLGSEIADLVNAYLSVHPRLGMVERTEMKKILEEQGLSRSGSIDQEQAIRIGRMVGAQLLVTGRVFPIDGELVIVARIIGAETSRVFGSVVKGQPGEKATGLAEEVASRIAEVIEDKRAELLPPATPEENRIAVIREAARDRELPRISIVIYEEHNSRLSAQSIAETELISILRECGFEVVRQERRLSPEWARDYLEDSTAEIPRLGDRADVLLVGEAFTETTPYPAPLISAKGRVELRAVETASGRILAAVRRTDTGADLVERSAAAAALETATFEAAVGIIPGILDHWSP